MMMQEAASAEYRLNRDIRFRRVFDEGVVVRIRTGEVLVVNGLGIRILELIEKEIPFERICEVLEQEYEVSPAELREDLVSFFGELNTTGVIEQRVSGGMEERVP